MLQYLFELGDHPVKKHLSQVNQRAFPRGLVWAASSRQQMFFGNRVGSAIFNSPFPRVAMQEALEAVEMVGDFITFGAAIVRVAMKKEIECMWYLSRSRIIVMGILALAYWSCAEQVAPTGGDKDTRAPQIDSSRYSTPNGSLNFDQEEVILTFDEWITLSDVFNQVIISPPLEEEPEIKVRRRSVVVSFAEELRDSTTYTINFGTAIQDITENNANQDFRFVFSTGNFLDSLRLRGELKEAATGAPAKEVMVLLYDDFSDSAVHKQKPFYFARTDENGRFQFYNLRADSFRIFALDDKNSNYKYDLDNERFAFLEEGFNLTDSSELYVKLRLFEKQPPLTFFQDNLIDYGQVDLVFNREPYDVEISPLNPPADYREYREREASAIRLWFEGSFEDSLLLHLRNGEAVDDTVVLKLSSSKTDFLATLDTLALAEEGAKGQRSRQQGQTSKPKIPANEAAIIKFNRPLLQIDTALLTVLDTAGQPFPAQYRLDTLQQLLISADWAAGEAYRLKAAPGSIQSWYGDSFQDTLEAEWQIGTASDFGLLTAKLEGAKADIPYVLELRKGDRLVERSVLTPPDTTHQFKDLLPGSYTLQVVEDENRNGRWDTGNYTERRQPERIITSETQAINAAWEGELLLKFDEIGAALKPEAEKQ